MEKSTGNKNFLEDMFSGKLEYKLERKQCKRVTITEEPFNCLMVNIPQGSKVNVDDCIKLFSKPEEICRRCECNDEQCTCGLTEKCKSAKAKQTKTIHTYPNILMIQIKRFADKKRKNNKYVSIPMKMHKENQTYALVGTVEHSGTLNTGHYKAKCWNDKRRKWYMMDDEKVEPIKPNMVSTEKAYLLFYAKKSDRHNKDVNEGDG